MAIIYVKPDVTGGDGTERNPYGTINEAFQLGQPQAGDEIYLRGGEYILNGSRYRGTQVINRSGTANERITVRNYPGETVNIKGSSDYPERVYTQYTPILLIQASYIHLEGIDITYGNGVGITIYPGPKDSPGWAPLTDISLINVNVSNCLMAGLNLNAINNLLIRGCHFVDNARTNWVRDKNNEWPVPQSWAGTITGTLLNDFTLEDCLLSGSGGEALVIEGTAFHMPPYSKDITVRNCTFYNNVFAHFYIHGIHEGTNIVENNTFYEGIPLPAFTDARRGAWPNAKGVHIATTEQVQQPNGGQFFSAPVRYWTVRNNIFTNLFAGILLDNLSVPDGVLSLIDDIDIYNNTINDCTYGVKNWGALPNQYGDNVNIKNNLVRCEGSDQEAANGNFVGVNADFNLWRGKINTAISGPNDLTAPPMLVDPDAVVLAGAFDPAKLKLRESSPAIDAGTTIYLESDSRDFFGNLRVNPPDIGAHEYVTPFISADFSATPTQGLAPLEVAFSDQSVSTSPINSWFWDFGDGSISTEKDPSHVFARGQFTVSLRVTGEAGNNIQTKNNLIEVESSPGNIPDRVVAGLSVLYRFDEGSGDTIYDVSGVGASLDLKISDKSAVEWLSQGIRISKPAMLVSGGPASKINNACRETNAFSIEIWLKPKNLSQDGPARIVSISNNAHSRNVTLGQGLWGTQPSDLFDLRLRTTERSANGMPSFSSPSGTADTSKSHLVVTRNKNGRTRIFVDKTIVAETFIPGDFSTWNPRFPLLLANETSGDNPWLGDIFLVAVYRRALSVDEVKQNFAAGTAVALAAEAQVSVSLGSFKRFVLVSSGSGSALIAGTQTTVAYGVQYPDLRCVLCANGQTTSMAIYPDINTIIRTYDKQGLELKWLD